MKAFCYVDAAVGTAIHQGFECGLRWLWFILQTEQMRVDIETCSPLSAGQTVCDVWHQSGLPKNCNVAKVRSQLNLPMVSCTNAFG